MPVDRERPRPFRRRQFRAPHRRRSLLLRLVRPFLAAVVLVGLPLAGALWVVTSPAFGIERITVAGPRRVPESWVEGRLRAFHGRHLLWVRLAEVEGRLVANPWIRGVTIRKELPGHLAVEVDERLPAALLRSGDELSYVDREGFVIATFEPALGGADLPLLSGVERTAEQVPAALELARRWARRRPEWKEGLSEVEVLGDDDYRVWSASLPFPVRLSAARLDAGLERLARLLPAIERRYPGATGVDLRFSHQIVIQPAAMLRSEEG